MKRLVSNGLIYAHWRCAKKIATPESAGINLQSVPDVSRLGLLLEAAHAAKEFSNSFYSLMLN